ncbi:DoxX family protein [Streptosporangium sp. NBC_01755]|uniref:DoxX family protein n=1 Tax=unclassified Streptosporangium TaxID=2632669 RepID=UPI002DDBA95A|nr:MULTISPECIES: DoxX family protein [unclassified Streptosporangium]WSA25544.1 DoxX family protein [Streptosporangium sp. NBC_01810]WSD03068.1 DoxX family protein [Streptosporangium sp. NBC_01755]
MGSTDGAVLLVRVAVGVIFIVHGLNHAFGGGKLSGTARWFAGLGMRHPRLQAVMSVAVEVVAGAALTLGLLTPVAAGVLVGVAVVAGLTAHARNGFFVFKDGYEYVLLLAVPCLAIALAGPGGVSLDAVLGIDALADGWAGLAVALLVGVGGAAVLLLATWRPVRERA